MANRKIKVLTFDLDDTLWPVGPVIVHAEGKLREWIRVNVPQAAHYDRETLLSLRAEVVADQPELVHDISTIRQLVLQALFERHAVANAAAQAATAFHVFLTARHDVEYYHEVEASLRTLSEHYTLGAVSNGNANVARLSIGEYFSFAISAESAGASKPDPRVFEATLKAAQCAPPELVHIGDHHEHDIAGAAQMGMRTVWINRSGDAFPGDTPPHATITDLSQLTETIENL